MKALLSGVALLFSAVLYCGAALAAPLSGVETFPIEQLKPGLKGVGYTVIRGTQIQTFDVEILERIPKGGFDGGPMILAKFTGPVVDHSRGIAGGYSGSPVYIGGKLLGAVSMAIPFTDTHIGGITPIGSMLPALPVDPVEFRQNTVLPETTNNGTDLDDAGNPFAPEDAPEPDPAPKTEPSAEQVEQSLEQLPAEDPQPEQEDKLPSPAPSTAAERIAIFTDMDKARAFNDRMRELGIDKFAGVRAATPVLTSGIDADVLREFGAPIGQRLGENFELVERPAGLGGAATPDMSLLLENSKAQSATAPGLFFGGADAPPLKPGAAVTVSLMTGDIEMSAIGTLTYSDPQGRFLIFGHPMMGLGATNMPLGEGYVTWTHTSIERAFKDGVRLRTLGTMTQDRGAACGGSFNERADMIPVSVKVKDIDLGTEKSMRFEVIRHPDFTPILVAMGLAQASQQVLDRQLGGTLKLSYHIEGAGLKEPLRRTNFFSDDADVVFNGAMEIVPVTNLLQTNIYRDVTITRMEVMVEITRNRINASIDDAKLVWDKPADASGGDAPSISGVPMESDIEGMQQALEGSEPQPTQAQDGQAPPQQNPQQPGQPQQAAGQPQAMMPGMMGMGMPNANMPTFAPGDEIKVRVRLQPYRTDPVWREFSIQVPPDFPSGNTMIMVHGGGDLISPSEVNGKGRSLFGMGPVIDVKERDLDSILDQISSWPLNNELLVTLVRPFDPTAPQELTHTTSSSGSAGATQPDKPADKVDATYQMEWVIYNGFMLPVNIMTKADQEAMAKAAEQMKLQMQQQGQQQRQNNAPRSEGGNSGGGRVENRFRDDN